MSKIKLVKIKKSQIVGLSCKRETVREQERKRERKREREKERETV